MQGKFFTFDPDYTGPMTAILARGLHCFLDDLPATMDDKHHFNFAAWTDFVIGKLLPVL